jgi:hypothetical protein
MADENRDDKEIEQQELERALSMLRPAASRIDRDCFLFLAGRASADSVRPGAAFGRWIWPGATFVSSLAAVVLLALLVTRSEPRTAHEGLIEAKHDQPPVPVVAASGSSALEQSAPFVDRSTVPAPTADETARAMAAESNYPRLRSFVLAYGIDALPEPAPIQKSDSASQRDDEPATVRELLRQTLKNRSAG